jgi:hypothetical protein
VKQNWKKKIYVETRRDAIKRKALWGVIILAMIGVMYRKIIFAMF